jgi:NDP-sugar pyrophosphorylase family protein
MAPEVRSVEIIASHTLQVLVPLAGPSSFFPAEEYHFPKPLIEVAGAPMIQRVVENLKSTATSVKFIFVVHFEDVRKFSLDKTLMLLTEESSAIQSLRQPAQGALCSCLMAIDAIDLEKPILIANGDQIIDCDLADIVTTIIASNASAGVLTFDSVHPRWSYVKVNERCEVLQAAEKRVISGNAIAGLYFFRTGRIFVDAAFRCIAAEQHVDGKYFIAPVLNELILDGHVVTAHRIPARQFHSFYSPLKIKEFEESRSWNDNEPWRSGNEIRVVIPAAGEGSRFATAGYAKPKPFIDVLGSPMISRVIANVAPAKSRTHVLARAEHLQREPDIVANLKVAGNAIHEVDKLTEGAACTILLARKAFDDDSPLLIANSDQLIDFDSDDFVNDCLRRRLDGSILVFDDVSRNPKWSFARIDANGLVVEVAEKRAISTLATAGIYLFARGSDFVRAAVDMIAANDRVNNEFYTCPVYNYMIKNGARIGIYKVAASAMHGLGTPEDLNEYLKPGGGGGN